MQRKTGNMKYPFKGISKEKFYVEGHPRFCEKVEEISLSWKEEFDRGKKCALAELLREGGPAFLRVRWVKKQIRAWEQSEDCEARIRFKEVRTLLSERCHGINGEKPFSEKRVMLKDYETYFAKYIGLQEIRREICGGCVRYAKDPLVVSCLEACDYPDRFDKLRKAADADDHNRPLKCVFKYPPYRMALRLTVIDGEIYHKRQKARTGNKKTG